MRCFKKSPNKSTETGKAPQKAAPIHPIASNPLDVIKEESDEEEVEKSSESVLQISSENMESKLSVNNKPANIVCSPRVANDLGEDVNTERSGHYEEDKIVRKRSLSEAQEDLEAAK